MNTTLVANWNKKVHPTDAVYFLGDFCWFNQNSNVDPAYWRSQLNGRIFFIRGNHDKHIEKYEDQFIWIKDMHQIVVQGQEITLCHYSMRTWNKSHHAAWQLFGHSHGSLPDDPNSLSIDVGVDCHGYAPISFEEIKAIMAKKTWKPIDHHGGTK